MDDISVFDYNDSGVVFTACNQAAKAVTLIDTLSATGFILSNPWGSGKKLGLISATFQHTTVPTATGIVFLCLSITPSSVDQTGTAINVYAADGSGASTVSVARAFSISTLPVLPVYTMAMGYSPTTPATTGGLVADAQINGTLILVPGTYVMFSYITTAPTGIGSMTWVELDQ